MCKVQELRSAHSLVSIPVGKAIYCQHCENITNSAADHCGECGSAFVLHLATLINQAPGGPDSDPASQGCLVPILLLDVARAA
jgi:hypothetical protein